MSETVSNEQLAKKVEYLEDEYIRMKKMYEDLFYNLDYDNFGTVVRKDMGYFWQAFKEVFPDGTEAMSSIMQTAIEIRFEVSESFDGVTQKISQVSQTADKINWLVKDGTNAGNFTLTSRMASLVANEINLTGYVTFASLESEGITTINGPDITGGTITGSLIQGATLASMGGSGKVEIHDTSMVFYNGSDVHGTINFNDNILQLASFGTVQLMGAGIVLNYTGGAYLRQGLGDYRHIATLVDINNAIATHIMAYHH